METILMVLLIFGIFILDGTYNKITIGLKDELVSRWPDTFSSWSKDDWEFVSSLMAITPVLNLIVLFRYRHVNIK